MISKSTCHETSNRSSKKVDDDTLHQSINGTLNYYTLQWWILLCSISLLNIAIWIYSYRSLLNNGNDNNNIDNDNINNHHKYQKHHLLLSGIYVFVCAYRSFLPRIDLERYCLWDTFASSIFLGRFFATIAEISFATQIALFLYQLGQVHDIPMACKLAVVLVPLIVIAQGFCWCGVVTLNYGYHAIEGEYIGISHIYANLYFVSLNMSHTSLLTLYLNIKRVFGLLAVL